MGKKEVMELVGARLKAARKKAGLTQEQLAKMVSCNSKSEISKYERGVRDIPRTKIKAFADALDISPIDIIGIEEDEKRLQPDLVPIKEKFKKGWLVGDIACGDPIYQEECEEITLPVNADIALYCHGDSMINVGINDGDIVYIKYADALDEMLNGRIIAVGIGDDYEYTLKRCFYNEQKHLLKLVPENDNMKPRYFEGEDLNQIHLLGVAVGYMSIL